MASILAQRNNYKTIINNIMKRAERIEEFLGGLKTEIDILDMVDCDNVSSYDNVCRAIEDNNGFDIELIYYSRAMEYLSENDPSLHESLGIAAEMGFSLDSLSSETLASLLASSQVRDEFYELEDEITDFFDELDNEEDFTCPNCGETYLESSISDNICPECQNEITEED